MDEASQAGSTRSLRLGRVRLQLAHMSERPRFYFDLSSPYAWLAAERIGSVLPRPPLWQPISFPFVLQATGKRPWSFEPNRSEDMGEIERRAAERGLPPVRWPQGWPIETYSLPALRAAVFAAESGQIEGFSLAAFRKQFTAGEGLNELETVLATAAAAGLDPEAVREAIQRDTIKERLKQATEAAIERGVTGIPTVQVGETLFWGDDRLEQAAAAVEAS